MARLSLILALALPSAALGLSLGARFRPARMLAPALSKPEAAVPDEWPLLRQLRQAVFDYELIRPGDRIAVAVSGGKDSSTLAYLLRRLKERRLLPFDDWSFVTIHLDQVQPGHDASSLQTWLEDEQGLDFHLLREDTYSVVTEKTKAGSSYCSLCSRLRRGILYTAAAELGCNRLALGHHRDDALETLLLNMCHQGQLKALPARYVAQRGLDVIRPLIYSAEDDIAAFAGARGFPILPCNLCGSQPDGTPGQRASMKLLLSALDGVGDGTARATMLRALGDVRPTHLLDRALREACGLDAASGEVRDWARARHVAHVPGAGGEQPPRQPTAAEATVVDAEKGAAVGAEGPKAPEAIEATEAAEAAGARQNAGAQRAPAAGVSDARRSRFRRDHGPPLVVAPSLVSFEAAVREHVRPGDVVVEVGCQLGRTTRLLAVERRAARVLGVDLARELQGKSGRQSSGTYRSHATPGEAGLPEEIVELALLDPWDSPALHARLAAGHGGAAKKGGGEGGTDVGDGDGDGGGGGEEGGGALATDTSVDVLLLDVNSFLGNDLPLTALALARQLARSHPSLRAVLVKSRALSRLQRQLTTLPRLEAEAAAAAEAPEEEADAWQALPRLVATVGVRQYRAAAQQLLRTLPPGATVLEIGCHLGTSTALLHEAAAAAGGGGWCAGVDVSGSIIGRARALHPEVSFAVADAWDGRALREAWRQASRRHAAEAGGGVGRVAGPTVLCVDVGGLSSAQGELDTVALLRQLESTFDHGDDDDDDDDEGGEGGEGGGGGGGGGGRRQLQAIVVKSHCLSTTARTLLPADSRPHQPRAKRGGGVQTTTTVASPSSGSGSGSGSSDGSDADVDAAAATAATATAAREAARAQKLPGSDAPPTRARVREVLAARHAGVSVVLENVRKENVAVIARTAECLGVGDVHLVYSAEQVVATRGFGGWAEAVRAAWLSRLSKSATAWLNVTHHASWAECDAALRAQGCELLVATTPDEEGSVPLYGGGVSGGGDGGGGGGGGAAGDAAEGGWATQRLALLFGSEGSGLSEEAMAAADLRLSVPQVGMTQSLNVAACASMVLGETLRLRTAAAAALGVEPARLGEEESRAVEAHLLEGEAGLPARRHNKAASKAAMVQAGKVD